MPFADSPISEQRSRIIRVIEHAVEDAEFGMMPQRVDRFNVSRTYDGGYQIDTDGTDILKECDTSDKAIKYLVGKLLPSASDNGECV